MNHYQKQAFKELLKVFLVAIVGGGLTSVALTIFGIMPVVTVGMIAIFVYICYSFVQFQANVLETRDKMNKQINKTLGK